MGDVKITDVCLESGFRHLETRTPSLSINSCSFAFKQQLRRHVPAGLGGEHAALHCCEQPSLPAGTLSTTSMVAVECLQSSLLLVLPPLS